MLFSIAVELVCIIIGYDLPTLLDMMQGTVAVDFTAILWIMLDIVAMPIIYVWWHLDKWLGMPDKFPSRK